MPKKRNGQLGFKNGILTSCDCDNDNSDKNKLICDYTEAKWYLKFNPYITSGYRNANQPVQCIKSLLKWTNETLNIWTHLLGWLFFVFATIFDVILKEDFTLKKYSFNLIILAAFQACMLLSSLYHTFCCCSAVSYRRWLTADLFGVSLSLLAIYVTGIYYAFSIEPSGHWLWFYELTVIGIFLFALLMQVLPVKDDDSGFQWRLFVFGGWAAYGIIPTLHWTLIYGFQHPLVIFLLPRITLMYILSILAFVFYVTRFPECFFPGKMNYFGSSHQIWHCLIFVAFFHWHSTGLLWTEFHSFNSTSLVS